MKAAIFDMDGTLMDSMGEWNSLHYNNLISMGKTPPEDLRESTRRMKAQDAIDYVFNRFGLWDTREELVNQLYKQITIMYRERVKLKPYVIDYLHKLKKEKIPFCIATTTPRRYAIGALERQGILDLFDFVICEDDIGVDKHHPAIYQIAAKRLGFEPHDIIVFEDAYYAARTAKRAGFRVYVIADPAFEHRKGDLLTMCEKYVEDFSELL